MKIQGLTEPSFDEKSCPLTIDDANNIYHFSTNNIPYRSEVSSSSAFVYGIESFKQSIKEIPFGVQANIGGLLQKAGKTMQEYFPDGVDIFNGAVNVKIGDKLVEGGKLLSRTANRNLDVMRERYKKESPRLESAQQKVAFDFGSQGANWTSMLLAGPYSPFLMAGLTMTGETQERLEKWKETHGTVEGYEERQGEDSVWNVANSFVQGTIEKYLGSWAQVKAVKKGWGYVKAIGKNAIQEGFVEEPLQDVTDFYFDKLSGLSEDETLRDRMFGSLRGYVVASIFGGAGGYSAALYHRSTGIEIYKDVMKGTVPEQDLEKAATKAYEQDAKTMRDIITVELESSSSLQAKRGEVYESLYKAALEQVKVAKEQGGFPELQTEEDIANYVKSVADRFADETLAEAHRRNTVIEEVLDPSLIRYENGQLVMPMTKGTEGFDAEKIMAERTTEFSYDEILHKLRFEEMSAEEEQRLTDMLDVEKQRLSPLFDTARGVVEELENEYGLVNELTDLSDAITERKMSFKEARDALGESFPEEQLADLGDEIKLKDGVKGNSAEIGFEYLTNRVFDRYDELRAKAQNYRLLQESLDIANQNAELDANNPAYEGETININGVERTVYNSNGDRIAMSEPALRNFYNWFGDSKVVDEQGRPLVVYHGTNAEFDTFDISKAGNATNATNTTLGFFFTPHEDYAKTIGDKIMPVYLKALNMYEVGFAKNGEDYLTGNKKERLNVSRFSKDYEFVDGLKSIKEAVIKKYGEYNKENVAKWSKLVKDMGYDGIKVVTGDTQTFEVDFIPTAQYIAFNPNQIKSTSNRGTYSESDNIYLQSAYAGSRVDYDRPSLEAIGSGEGAQVHGWGLYYALNKDIAEGYREKFKRDNVYEIEEVKEKIEELGKDEAFNYYKEKAEKAKLGQTLYPEMYELKVAEEEKYNMMAELVKTEGEGQVHEVDIPENPYLLDENKNYENQSDYVKEKLQEFFKDKQVLDLIKGEKGKYAKSQIKFFFENKSENYSKVRELNELLFGTKTSETTPENARLLSELLYRHGIKGITYMGRQDGRCFVIFNPDDVKVIQKFYQENVGREKGSIQFKGDRALITLTEEANSSTLAHELAHYWLQNTFLYSKSGLATPEYKQFFNSIAKYLDITDDQETIKEWQQEKWARAAEMYAMGKAPEGMEGPLTQYQQWIRKAYGEMSEPMYIDENGEAKVPEFDFETMKMFANLAGETLTEPEFKQKQEAVRGLAKSTNQMAQAKGMKTELPTYEKRSATDMGKKADEFIQRDKQLAIDIVKGLKPEQEGLFRQDLFAALRELALNEGDSDLLNELSKSMTVEEATELGQRIQALARGRIDPVKQMVELRDERMKKNKVDKKKLKEETEKAKKEIKKEMAEASTPKEWAEFIKSLEC